MCDGSDNASIEQTSSLMLKKKFKSLLMLRTKILLPISILSSSSFGLWSENKGYFQRFENR